MDIKHSGFYRHNIEVKFMKTTFRILLIFLISNNLYSQYTLPYTFINNSPYEDSGVYIGLVGKFGNNVDVWMDMNTYTLIPMSAEQNTVDGPPWSTPSSWKYPDIFSKLSDITDNTLQIPQGLYGSRIFISFESPMYLHFHETGGYAGANLNSSSDPNDGIRWELVELTWGNSGLWTKSSRVDAYQFPISIEVSGFTGPLDAPNYVESYQSAIGGNGTPKYGKIGEKLTHDDILNRWESDVAAEYQVAKIIKEHSIDGGYIIEQPSKVEEFPKDIFDDYISDIWSVYSSHDLVIDIGDRGVWTGRVTGEEFNFVDPDDGTIATIYGKPSSFNAIEGSGFLASTNVDPNVNQEKHDEDLMIQAQIAAAINRHAIYTDIIDGTVQLTHDASRFFVYKPYNEYVKFFHNEDISYESQTYAFAYDDVGDHSSTIQTTFPTNARIIIGGYHQYMEAEPELTLISVSPHTQEIEKDNTLKFIATGYDQYSELYPTNVIWSTTGGGSIDENGLYTATTIGEHTITAQDGIISRSVNITVIEAKGLTGCQAESPNGDYNYIATNEPTITFIPKEEGYGDPVCLLYYKKSINGNYSVASPSPNLPEPLNASLGDTVFFYCTYSLPNGGENNTSGDPQSFIVGDCEVLSSPHLPNSILANLVIYPNPSNRNGTYLSKINDNIKIQIFNTNGLLLSSNVSGPNNLYKLKTSHLETGMYLVLVSTLDQKKNKLFKLFID